MLPVETPFKIYTGLDGKPLQNGYVWFGLPNQDPVTNPVTVYWDADGEIPAVQPLRTVNGYIMRAGTPANVFVDGAYSQIVRTAGMIQVFYASDSNEFDIGSIISADLNALQLADYNALLSYTGSRKLVYVVADGIFGPFERVTSGVDDGGVTRVGYSGIVWRRKYTGPIEVDWFGAYGATDAAPAITAAIAYAQSLQHGGTIAFRAGATYRLLSGLTWNSTLVGADGRGAFIDCSSVPAGTIVLAPTQYGIDDNERVGAAQMHPWENFIFRGPGYPQSTTAWLRVNAPMTESVNAGNTFRNITLQSFAIDVQLLRGAFFTTFDLMDFQGINGSGADTTYSIQIPADVNSGERTTFSNCLMGNRNYLFDQSNPNADTLFLNCSLNFSVRNSIVMSGGLVNMVGCHTEGVSDNDRWFQVSGQDALLNVSSHHLVINQPKTNFAPFYSDVSCTRGGVVINGMRITSQALTTRLIDGDGRAKVSDITCGNDSTAVLNSIFQNLLSYPSFESANYVNDWVFSGTHQPARTDAITAYSGSWCLEFPPLPGDAVTCAGYADVPCRPGDFAAVEFWYLTSAIVGTGGTFFASTRFIDKNGGTIGVEQTVLATQNNVGTWNKVMAGFPTAAPAGTHGFRLFFSLFGVNSGAPKGYIDSVAITVS